MDGEIAAGIAAPAIFFVGLALVGAALGRWTRWHPLAIAAGIGTLTTAPALVIVGATMSPAAASVAVIGGIVATAPAAFGAFLGWLRRKHRETGA